MKRATVLALFLSACTTGPLLFDGTSLSGWQVSGDANWSVVSGELVGAGEGDGFIFTLAEFDNFELSLEFYLDSPTNSGVFIRCQDRDNIHPHTCYELNIWDEHPQQEARTGAIVLRAMPPLARVTTTGRWNSLWVRAQDDELELRINGELTAVLKDAEFSRGFIALQRWRSGQVRFRELRLQAL